MFFYVLHILLVFPRPHWLFKWCFDRWKLAGTLKIRNHVPAWTCRTTLSCVQPSTRPEFTIPVQTSSLFSSGGLEGSMFQRNRQSYPVGTLSHFISMFHVRFSTAFSRHQDWTLPVLLLQSCLLPGDIAVMLEDPDPPHHGLPGGCGLRTPKKHLS